MPWKFIFFLFMLVITTVFIGFNLENRCDISLIFYTWKDVPIFVSLLFGYVVGAVTVLPVFFATRKKSLKKDIKKPGPKQYGGQGHDYNIN